MPIARIEVKRSWSSEHKQQLMLALHAAMMEALKIPEWDRQIRYVEHQAEHFLAPPGTSENYTLVELSMFPGRSLEAKRNLYQGIIKRFGELGIQPRDVFIVLNEIPMDNWGIRGRGSRFRSTNWIQD